MQLYPVFLSLERRSCLVVGDGPGAEKRIDALKQCGARVTLASTKTDRQTNSDFDHMRMQDTQEFLSIDFSNFWLVLAVAGDDELNANIAQQCETTKTFCHTENSFPDGSFILPAVVDRSPLLVAISTGAAAPALARALKTRLEALIPTTYSRLTEVIGRRQQQVKEIIPNRAERSGFWHNLLNGPVTNRAFSLDEQNIEHIVDEELTKHKQKASGQKSLGSVSLVGAGPGDPDLLTFRALRLIQSADVLVYDRLVSESILDLRRADAEMIYAGKAMANHTIPQESINQLLVKLALNGHQVVRLKGGDPFIFGRGGEEIETLAEESIPFQVVPGITAASGCAAFSGIPLTHREHAQSCTFVTGHLRNGEINLQWDHLCDQDQTLIVYMGLTGLPVICERLIAAGRDKTTPAALVEQGTTPRQKVYTGSIETLPGIVKNSEVRAPTLLIIGSVVSLREKLDWFSSIDSEISEHTTDR